MEGVMLTRTFAANTDALEPIRGLITTAGNNAGLHKKKIYNLCLAVDEIATNIINHGYIESGIKNGCFDVMLSADASRLTVILEDAAIPFDPLKHELPTQQDLGKPLEDRPIGGLGVMIAKQSVDSYKYEFINGRNRNIFIVNL